MDAQATIIAAFVAACERLDKYHRYLDRALGRCICAPGGTCVDCREANAFLDACGREGLVAAGERLARERTNTATPLWGN
jgi:hypothetical protein